MFALCDANNFYASCERVFQPQLNGKPIVVLSNNDGCAVARSNEAKELGIPMGAPAFEYRELFEKHDVQVFSSNYALYGDMSARVMAMLGEFTPDMEVYSIDEAFLNFDGYEQYHDLRAIGFEMKRKVTKGTGIPISIGFAPTKALAKVANRIAKKYPDETGGVYVMDSQEKIEKAIHWLRIEDVWGIGRQHSKRLSDKGVKTAYDFTLMPDFWVKKNMSVVGLRLKKELAGIRTLELEEEKKKQNIACTRSFDRDYTTFEELKERVVTFAAVCGAKLRAQDSHCNVITVFILTNSFKQHLPQYNKSYTVDLPFPTNSSIELAHFCTNALKAIFKPGYSYKKAGVIVQEFTPADCAQKMLFQNTDPRHSQLFAVVDRLNKSIGANKVKLAAQDLGRTWKMRQEKLSRRYTTRFDEIIDIFCR